MQNIFPIAQKAIIEETIGINRPSASPIAYQSVKESTINMDTQRKQSNAKVAYVKPSWFFFDTISEREKNMLGDLTNNESCINEYLAIRNSIVEYYEKTKAYVPLQIVLKTNNYLLATVAFNFLEDNKVINYNIDLLTAVESINDDLTQTDAIKADYSSKIAHYYESKETRKVKEKYFKKEMLENSVCSCGQKSLYFTSDLLFICESCFNSNNFPTSYSPRNFHKLTADLLNCIWTREEEYKLLKNIENYGDAWSKVTEGLTKSFEQCIFHFIKMSIIEDVTSYPPIPFTQVPNAISTLIAFICSLVYPSISTELARVALQHVNNPNLMDILLKTAKDKGREVLSMERLKIEKLKTVESEALVKRVMLKIDSINEMSAEIQAVKSELEDEREKLMEEFTKAK